MAKRKQKSSEMPPDIDLEEWEEMVAEKRDAIRYDEEFLELCKFFICAQAAADVVDDQFSRRMSPDDRKIINNLLNQLSFVGYVMECPADYMKGDEDDFINEHYLDDGTTPKPLVEALLRLAYYAGNSIDAMKNPNFFGY